MQERRRHQPPVLQAQQEVRHRSPPPGVRGRIPPGATAASSGKSAQPPLQQAVLGEQLQREGAHVEHQQLGRRAAVLGLLHVSEELAAQLHAPSVDALPVRARRVGIEHTATQHGWHVSAYLRGGDGGDGRHQRCAAPHVVHASAEAAAGFRAPLASAVRAAGAWRAKRTALPPFLQLLKSRWCERR
eukprot:scaffold1073_cov383-Prasinococcus_capsulatus_cf.AAC.11